MDLHTSPLEGLATPHPSGGTLSLGHMGKLLVAVPPCSELYSIPLADAFFTRI